MTQAGGPAAINGFLYQILHHLAWITEVSLSGTLDGALIDDACLVLEPRNGGDARAEATGVYLVEQYKTRKDRTWSVKDIVAVLSDLRKAVPSQLPSFACYRFVTDGRPGNLSSLNAFLTDVKLVSTPDDLDKSEEKNFSSGLLFTNNEFFEYVVTSSQIAGKHSADDERMKVFHLLQNLELEFGSYGAEKSYAADKLLRRYAPNLGDESGIRERLVGILVEKLSKGEARLDRQEINDMFRNVGLNPERMVRLEQLAETMGERTRRRLERLGYRSEQDVRGPPDWPDGKPVLLIAGKSGMGKTWQLGHLLETLAQSREVATLVLFNSVPETVLSEAARDIWQTGLGESSEKQLVGVERHLRELMPNAGGCKVTIAVDDIQDVDVARALIRQDWAEWGMRLTMTVSNNLAHALNSTDSERIHLHQVGDFSINELDCLLRLNGKRWTELPSDLKKLLRAPILAGLFLKLPYSSIQRAPRSEYEIFESFWERIASSDVGIVLALATLFVGGETYPLPRQRWNEIGLNDESRARLEAAGWLRNTEYGEVAFAHDRLLNWAVAKEFVRQYQHNQLSVEKLGEIFSGGSSEDQSQWRRLGYVPMDAIWLLGSNDKNAEPLGLIVARMEQSREYGSYGGELYKHLLPTLGQRAVPILLSRLHSVVSDEARDYRVSLIGQAFASLARQDHVDLANVVKPLLRSSSWDLQSVAIVVLTVAPDVDWLDRIWEIHQHCVAILEDRSNRLSHEGYQSTMAALRAGVAHSPEWLRLRILSVDPGKESICDLGYLLNTLEHPDALTIWRETRDRLIEMMPASKPRSLLHCISRFGDREKIDFITQNLTQQHDFASGAALYALSVLDPLAAIDRLEEIGESERYVSRNHWLPGLLRAEPELTLHRVLALAKAQPRGRHMIEILFGERPDEINEAMLRFVLRSLEQDLLEDLDAISVGDLSWPDHPLRFLGAITRPDLLSIIMAEAGGELERLITTVGCSRLRFNSRSMDHILESARRLLILIGGEGLTELLSKELESQHYWVRHNGLNWAFTRRDDGIIKRLTAIAHQSDARGIEGKSREEFNHEFYKAIQGLGALGADDTLVNILITSEAKNIPDNLALLRSYRNPIATELIGKANFILSNEGAAQDELYLALIVAWVSGNETLMPRVHELLATTDPASDLAIYICIALSELGDVSVEFAHFAFNVALTKDNAWWGLKALTNLGDLGTDLLTEWLQSLNADSRADYESFVINVLYENPTTRTLASEAAALICQHSFNFGDPLYKIAAEKEDTALRDQILDKAFSGNAFFVTEPLSAIEGLAKFDMARAVDAIELAFQAHPKIERELARLLVRLAPDVAAEKLMNAAFMIERDSIRSAVGQALRQLDPATIAPLFAERVKGTASERKVIAELAAWLPVPQINNALVGLADQDSASEVRHLALLALEYHRKEAGLRALLEAFKTAGYDKQWSLLTAILNGADAHLLKSRDDPLWLGHILTDELPFIFEHHANNVLNQRTQRGK